MKLDENTLTRIAELSKIKISDEDRAEVMAEMQKMLDFTNSMNDVNLDGIEPTTQLIPTYNVFREDVVTPSMDREKLLAGAPTVNEGEDCISVPAMTAGR